MTFYDSSSCEEKVDGEEKEKRTSLTAWQSNEGGKKSQKKKKKEKTDSYPILEAGPILCVRRRSKKGGKKEKGKKNQEKGRGGPMPC